MPSARPFFVGGLRRDSSLSTGQPFTLARDLRRPSLPIGSQTEFRLWPHESDPSTFPTPPIVLFCRHIPLKGVFQRNRRARNQSGESTKKWLDPRSSGPGRRRRSIPLREIVWRSLRKRSRTDQRRHAILYWLLLQAFRIRYTLCFGAKQSVEPEHSDKQVASRIR